MAENDKLLQITTVPKRAGFGGKITKLYRKRQLVISVIGAYILVGGLLGFILFNSTGDKAKASDDVAQITPIIDLVDSNTKELAIGDTVEVKVTLQNRSSTEAVNNLAIEFFSTKNAVNWTQINSQTSPNQGPILAQNNVFKLAVLSAGERSSFIAKGMLQNEDSNFLTILVKIRYLNIEGQQEINSNRVFTELKGQKSKNEDLVDLKINKETYLRGEEITLGLNVGDAAELSSDFELKGKVYISQQNSDQLANSIDCIFSADGVCNITTAINTPGIYSALFMSDDESFSSNISQFQVAGTAGSTTTNPQVTIQYPFGTKSINGVVPVFASRVISLNNVVGPEDLCIFEVLQGDKVVTEVTAAVKSDRTCSAFINASQISTGDGVYGIRLKGSEAKKDVSILRKNPNLLKLQTGTSSQLVASPVSIISSAINDIAGNPVTSSKVSLGIIHRDSGDFQEISALNGQQLAAVSGQFSAEIPALYFGKGGQYLLYITTDSGQSSDFLSVDYGGKEVGLVYSGVIVDNYENLQVGKNITFSLENITDKSGNSIANGACFAAIYSKSSNTTPLVVGGSIQNGNCSVFVEAGKITVSGPTLVSFTAPEINNDINQSRQFIISAAEPKSYGQLNLEYEPARKGYANNIVLGPITDSYGNITDGYGLKLEVINNNEVIKVIDSINTTNGFTTITIPSSVFGSDSVTVRLSDSTKKEVFSKEIPLSNDNSALTLPVIPSEINNDNVISISIPNLLLKIGETCKIKTYLLSGEEIAVDALYDSQSQSCDLKWDLNQNRNNPKMLLVVEAGERKFSYVLNLRSGEASNLFVLSPATRIDSKDELHVSLLTSVITDKYGLPIYEGKLRVQYNGKTKEVPVQNGQSSLSITANELSSKDIRQVFSMGYLDLNLEANASALSINKTNYITVFLGEKNVAINDSSFAIVAAQSHLTLGAHRIFAFKSEICRALIISENTTTASLLNTHKQGDICYVEVDKVTVPSTILFEQKGYVVGSFDVTPVTQTHRVRWCTTNNCLVQVVAPLNSVVDADVYDGNNVYNFKSGELENVVKISQNGLNPTKDYLVKVSFKNNTGENVTAYKTIAGELLTVNNANSTTNPTN